MKWSKKKVEEPVVFVEVPAPLSVDERVSILEQLERTLPEMQKMANSVQVDTYSPMWGSHFKDLLRDVEFKLNLAYAERARAARGGK